jgi:hypothetical protein
MLPTGVFSSRIEYATTDPDIHIIAHEAMRQTEADGDWDVIVDHFIGRHPNQLTWLAIDRDEEVPVGRLLTELQDEHIRSL